MPPVASKRFHHVVVVGFVLVFYAFSAQAFCVYNNDKTDNKYWVIAAPHDYDTFKTYLDKGIPRSCCHYSDKECGDGDRYRSMVLLFFKNKPVSGDGR